MSILLILMDTWCIFVDSDVHAFLSNDESPPPRVEDTKASTSGSALTPERADNLFPKASSGVGVMDSYLCVLTYTLA